MNIITVGQALKIIHSGAPFTFQVVTYDKTRKKGGRLIEGEARLLKKNDHPDPELEFPDMPAARPMTEIEAKKAALDLPATGSSKDPNHHYHFTRNIVLLADGHPVHPPLKIRPPLLIQFNGMEVVP